jgi:hypothetical protein
MSNHVWLTGVIAKEDANRKIGRMPLREEGLTMKSHLLRLTVQNREM